MENNAALNKKNSYYTENEKKLLLDAVLPIE